MMLPVPARAATAQVQRFTDVPSTRSDFAAINWMAERGITGGLGGSNRFGPDRTVTRGEFAAFLWRYAGQPTAPTSCGFTDVRSTSYVARPSCWMKAQGLTNGVNPAGTLFGPDRTIPRAQSVAMLWRFIGSPVSTVPHGFTDIPADAYYGPAVQWFKEFGLTSGTSATKFSPNNNITRGQSALFLHRYEMSQLGSSTPGTSGVDGVVGSWVGSWSDTRPLTDWERFQTGLRQGVPVATFGGVLEVKIAEPADRPVEMAQIALPSYLPDAHTNGTAVGVVSGECAGTPTTARDLQKVTIERFYCSDANTDGTINGVVTLHLSGFAHTVRTAGPRGGFAFTYGTADDVRRPTNSLVANFRDDSPYFKWGETTETLDRYPTQTQVFTEMYNSVPFRLGFGMTQIDVNNPASATITGIRIRFNNETSHLGLTFDNDAAFDERDWMASWGGGDWVSRDPGFEDGTVASYRNVNKLMVTGECSSDPTAFVFPDTIWTKWEIRGVVYGVGDTLYAEGFECKDWDGDGRINSRIGVFYQYLNSEARSYPHAYSKELCPEPDLASIALGCIDFKDVQYLYGADAATIELVSDGTVVPVPFADTEYMSFLAESNIPQYCSNDPQGCYPDQNYPDHITKDAFGVKTCLLYPYLCWPESNWPTEYQQDIDRTCTRFPTRCDATNPERPKSVVPWYGVDPYD